MLSMLVQATKNGKKMRLATKQPPIAYNVYDTHSGEGEYTHKGKKYLGSPIQILDAFYRIKNPKTKTQGLKAPVRLYYSDIEATKVVDMKSNLHEHEQRLKSKFNYTGHSINYWCDTRPAADTINLVIKEAEKRPGEIFILWIDPNALKDMPVEQIQHVISIDAKNIAVMVNMSTMVIKKTFGAYKADETMKRSSSLLNYWINQGVEKEDLTVPFMVKEIFGKHADKVFINSEPMGTYQFYIACRFRDFYLGKDAMLWEKQKIARMKELVWK